MNSKSVHCNLKIKKRVKTQNFIQLFMTCKKHQESKSCTPQNYQGEKKKKKKLEIKKINKRA